MNNGYGISLSSSSNNLLSGNNASNNHYSISLSSSSNNTLIGNNASNNGNPMWGTGISLDSSNNNKIFHNNLIQNPNQACDYSNNNFWDSGYPSGGNYWSDYTGVDLNSGSSQNIPGSDGIGDSPYSIPGGSSVDRYPLMVPYIPISGDIDGDGQVTTTDALIYLKYSVGQNVPYPISDSDDVTCDGIVDIVDALAVLKKAVDENFNFCVP